MGQRLIMNIHKNRGEEPIINVYYHWSAYSRSAYCEAQDFINAYNSIEKTGVLETDIIRALENIGARVEIEDRQYVHEQLGFEPLEDNLDSNKGLIALSEEQRLTNLDYAEGEIQIFMNDKDIDNLCFWEENETEFYEMHDEDKIIEIPQIDDLEYTTFDDLEVTLYTLDNMTRSNIYQYRNMNNRIISLIE